MRYELIAAKTNADTTYLLTRNGQVISRWSNIADSAKWDRLACAHVWDELHLWDDQAACGDDLSDYQADLDGGRYDVDVLAVEIDGNHPRYIAGDAVSAAIKELDLPSGLRSPVDYTDATTAVARLLIDGRFPEWYGSIGFYQGKAAERAARNLGVWPYVAAK